MSMVTFSDMAGQPPSPQPSGIRDHRGLQVAFKSWRNQAWYNPINAYRNYQTPQGKAFVSWFL